jgi:hypothetical protein
MMFDIGQSSAGKERKKCRRRIVSIPDIMVWVQRSKLRRAKHGLAGKET